MVLECTSGPHAGWSGTAEITTDHPASRDGVPVLVVNGDPVPILDAAEAGFTLVSATAEERRALAFAGYRIAEADAEDAQPSS